MKKHLIAALAACALCFGLLAGCAGNNQASSSTEGDASTDKVSVVCASFPAYDWVTQVVGDQADNFDIAYLLENGVDLHSYSPSVEDIAKIADCNLFVYVGGESDSWAEDAIEAAGNPDMHAVSMMGVMGDSAVEEEVVEGMQEEAHEHEHEDGDHDENGDHDEDADHDEDGEEHEHGDEPEYDEHVWLSLKNAQVLVDAIATELAAIDAGNAAVYTANAAAYNAELDKLDKRYAEAVSSAAKDTVIFADRFPFRYLVDDYGLKYYAAFVGCSAETEASFETVAFLAKKVDELGVGTLLVLEDSDQKIAQTVSENTQAKDQAIAIMDSLQSVTADDIAGGKAYLGAMEDNLAVLTAALA